MKHKQIVLRNGINKSNKQCISNKTKTWTQVFRGSTVMQEVASAIATRAQERGCKERNERAKNIIN